MRRACKKVMKELQKRYPEAQAVSVYTCERIGKNGEESVNFEIWVFTDEEIVPHAYGNTLEIAYKNFKEKYDVTQTDTTTAGSAETGTPDATVDGDSGAGLPE